MTCDQPNTRILLVEDDTRLAELIQEYLQQQGFEVEIESRGNLVRNALRYAERDVHVSLMVDPPWITIGVEDDGPGIPPESRHVVFEPFRRLDTSRNRESGGCGLGLAMVQRIATTHQGDVQVDDSPLGGARFYLRWPGLQSPSDSRV